MASAEVGSDLGKDEGLSSVDKNVVNVELGDDIYGKLIILG